MCEWAEAKGRKTRVKPNSALLAQMGEVGARVTIFYVGETAEMAKENEGVGQQMNIVGL